MPTFMKVAGHGRAGYWYKCSCDEFQVELECVWRGWSVYSCSNQSQPLVISRVLPLYPHTLDIVPLMLHATTAPSGFNLTDWLNSYLYWLSTQSRKHGIDSPLMEWGGGWVWCLNTSTNIIATRSLSSWNELLWCWLEVKSIRYELVAKEDRRISACQVLPRFI